MHLNVNHLHRAMTLNILERTEIQVHSFAIQNIQAVYSLEKPNAMLIPGLIQLQFTQLIKNVPSRMSNHSWLFYTLIITDLILQVACQATT